MTLLNNFVALVAISTLLYSCIYTLFYVRAMGDEISVLRENLKIANERWKQANLLLTSKVQTNTPHFTPTKDEKPIDQSEYSSLLFIHSFVSGNSYCIYYIL